MNDFRRPVSVPEFLVFGIDGQAQQVFGAVLHAGETPHALEKKEIRVFKSPYVFGFLTVAIIYAGFLHTVVAPCTVFAPIHDAVLPDPRQPRGNGRGMNVVFFWHIKLSRVHP
jgi:hypothetical protein